MINDLAKKLLQAIKQVDKTTTGYDTAATVKRIEGDTAWVHIPGGVDETPVKLTINASEGDTVQVRVNGGRAWLQGNATAPPTDDKTAIISQEIATEAKYTAETAMADSITAHEAAVSATESAATAGRAASVAQTAAEAALATANTKKQVFLEQPTPPYQVGDLWVRFNETNYENTDANGNNLVDSDSNLFQFTELNGSDVYTCLTPKPASGTFDEDDWSICATDNTSLNELREWFWHDANGAHVLGDVSGYRNDITSTGMKIMNTSTETSVAEFLADGATIKAGNGTEIAHLGYGSGNAQSGTSDAPYYTLGTRDLGSKGYPSVPAYSSLSTYAVGALCTYNGTIYVCKTAITTAEAWNASHWQLLIGNYSVVEGEYSIASGCDSHAEGRYTEANGYCSHAEGGPNGSPVNGPRANGNYSHAEGSNTEANGVMSHAEGVSSISNGKYSHAQNIGTIANGDSQTALGKYNDPGNYAVMIGNGTADNARSNALTVDWDGNVNIPSGSSYQIAGVPIGGGGGTSDYSQLTNKPSINNVTLSGNKTTSDLSIHDIPSGGSSGQVLTKNSGTNYDVTWTTPSGSGVSDVKINGASVVSSGVATIPKATNSTWGVVKVQNGATEGSNTFMGVIYRDNDSIKFPTLSGDYELSPSVMPLATQSTLGAMSATDKTKLDGIATGAEANVLEGVQTNGTDLTISNKKVNIPLFTGATTSQAGSLGLVPAPARMTSGVYKILLDDGSWHDFTASVYQTTTTCYITLNIDGSAYEQLDITQATDSYSGVLTPTYKKAIDGLLSTGSVYETTDSTVDPASLFGGTWSILGQLKTSSNVEIMTSNNEKIYAAASGMEPERTYKWVRTILM